ncbi:ATP-binding cassette domain-containing protein [uncultured Rubinisphaera sp.]|uniref:ATP-binding cassette domain-containing protein n=1 Tax=uncultured Rubinisphaera sp. TaxID=1678686 RepID=UPI000EC1C2E9|nr:hypothetical protein [Planctomycetaceae bacterium]|tara:strand:- start:35 stop:811 length:777 start_codon:yes stop_codon:yes gene_type:complete
MKIDLNNHPTVTWSPEFKPGEKKTFQATHIQYRNALTDEAELQLAYETCEKSLLVQVSGSEEETNLPVFVAGKRCYTQVLSLKKGELLVLGKYAWVLRTYASGQGAKLIPIDPLQGECLTLKKVEVDHRLNIPYLHIPAGQSVVIIGGSGAGKSTLIRELVEVRKGNGELRIGGVSRQWPHDTASLKIAYLPQMDLVHDDLTLHQQTKSLISMVNPHQAVKETDECLRAVGLFDDKKKFPNQVSGGELRRARLAAALV